MKQTKLVLLSAAVVAGIIVSCNSNSETKTVEITKKIDGPAEPTKEELIQRGQYLVTIGGCGDCHTPKMMTEKGPVPDTSRMLSGHRGNSKMNEISTDAFAKGWVLFNNENTALATPGFVSFSANITSDATGIGTWTYEQFKTALTKGKWKGMENSRDLLPPMPWQNYVNMKDEDIRAIFEYLKSTKPISNIVPSPIFPQAAK